jgi:hypothetical protein
MRGALALVQVLAMVLVVHAVQFQVDLLCADDDGPGGEGRAFNGQILNGHILNGHILNGQALNGWAVKGRVF